MFTSNKLARRFCDPRRNHLRLGSRGVPLRFLCSLHGRAQFLHANKKEGNSTNLDRRPMVKLLRFESYVKRGCSAIFQSSKKAAYDRVQRGLQQTSYMIRQGFQSARIGRESRPTNDESMSPVMSALNLLCRATDEHRLAIHSVGILTGYHRPTTLVLSAATPQWLTGVHEDCAYRPNCQDGSRLYTSLLGPSAATKLQVPRLEATREAHSTATTDTHCRRTERASHIIPNCRFRE